MTRRGVLKRLLTAGIWTVWKGRSEAVQLSSMKEVEALQKKLEDAPRRGCDVTATDRAA
jgi:hypothetical protein